MSGKPPALLDASLVLTLSGAGVLERVLLASRYEWHITPLVRNEVVRRKTRDVIDRAITAGRLQVTDVDITDPVQLDAWVEWERLIDIGEAEAIALAPARGWVIGVEARQVQRVLDRRLGAGRWVNATNDRSTTCAVGHPDCCSHRSMVRGETPLQLATSSTPRLAGADRMPSTMKVRSADGTCGMMW
jgi:hypothetical protein